MFIFVVDVVWLAVPIFALRIIFVVIIVVEHFDRVYVGDFKST